MTPYSLRRRRLARFCYVLAMLSLAAGLLAGFASRDPWLGAFFMLAGVAGYILNGRRATALFSMESRKASLARQDLPPTGVIPRTSSRPARCGQRRTPSREGPLRCLFRISFGGLPDFFFRRRHAAPIMKNDRKAAFFAGLAFAALLGGCLLASVIPGATVAWVVAGFVGYVACGRRAIILWRADDLWRDDEIVFEPRRRRDRRHVRTAKLVAAGAFAAALAAPTLAQQTIFNVPSADVLDKGKTYLEADALWRPQDPSFGFFTMRGVYGFGSNIEAGANFGGFAFDRPLGSLRHGQRQVAALAQRQARVHDRRDSGSSICADPRTATPRPSGTGRPPTS